MALSQNNWSKPTVEIRFYYDTVTGTGIRISSEHFEEPYVIINQDQYAQLGMAFKYRVVNGVITEISNKTQAEKKLIADSNGIYGTVKDCIIFADPSGPDRYNIV